MITMALFHVEGHFHYVVEANSEEEALAEEVDFGDCLIDVSEVWEETNPQYCTRCGKLCHVDHGCPTHGWNDRELVHCPHCGTKYWDEDIHMSREYEEFWGAPCSYEIFDHAICHECGERYE